MSIPPPFHLPYRIVLGSGSPRRRQLLKELGFDFTVEVSEIDEGAWLPQLRGHEIPLYLAVKKSKAFARPLAPDELLITADTIVWHQGRVYNKPADEDEAIKMLSALSGSMHEVFTGVHLRTNKCERSFFSASRVHFKSLSANEINYYVANFRPFDKAGSYGIQDWLGYVGITRIEGSFYNIVGLPVHELYEVLESYAKAK